MNNDNLIVFRQPIFDDVLFGNFLGFRYYTLDNVSPQSSPCYYTDGELQKRYSRDHFLLYRGKWERCTGLKDKNGTLIYENDSVEDDDTKDNQFIIVFDCDTARFMMQAVNNKNDKRLIKKNVRIIGNIHTDKGE